MVMGKMHKECRCLSNAWFKSIKIQCNARLSFDVSSTRSDYGSFGAPALINVKGTVQRWLKWKH